MAPLPWLSPLIRPLHVLSPLSSFLSPLSTSTYLLSLDYLRVRTVLACQVRLRCDILSYLNWRDHYVRRMAVHTAC